MIRCLIAFVILAVPAAAQPSIVTSGGGRSIVMSGPENTSRPIETASAASGKAEQVKTPVISGNPASPPVLKSDLDELWMEIGFLKSALAAATAPPIRTMPLPAAKRKPILKIQTISNCPPCRNMKADIEAGLFSDFEIEYEDPSSAFGYPLIRFEQDGEWLHLVDRSSGANRGYDRSVLEDLKLICLSGVKAEDTKKSQATVQTAEIPGRYAMWDGAQYDFEKWSPCSASRCRMCQHLRPQYQAYWNLKNQAGYRTTSLTTSSSLEIDIPDHQEPTPDDLIDQMITLMNLTSSDVFADIGCGDGRILIAAVQRSGCRAIGVEIDPIKADEARRSVTAAGLSQSIVILTGDALEFDAISHGVTAAVTYLPLDLLQKLAPALQQIRVVVCPFHSVPGLRMTEHNDIFVYRK